MNEVSMEYCFSSFKLSHDEPSKFVTSNRLYVDSCSSTNMVGIGTNLSNVEIYHSDVLTANGVIKSSLKGTACFTLDAKIYDGDKCYDSSFKFSFSTIVLNGLDRHLLSVSKLSSNSIFINTESNEIIFKDGPLLQRRAPLKKDEAGLYYIQVNEEYCIQNEQLKNMTSSFFNAVYSSEFTNTSDLNIEIPSLCFLTIEEQSDGYTCMFSGSTNDGNEALLYHSRFGHYSRKYIKNLHNVLTDKSDLKKKRPVPVYAVHNRSNDCKCCMIGKGTRPSMGVSKLANSVVVGEVIHSDIWYSGEKGVNGNIYLIHFTDEASDYTKLYALKSMNIGEVIKCFENFIAFAESCGHTVKMLYSDNVPYKSDEMKTFCEGKNIRQDFSAPYVHAHQGKAERVWLTLDRISRSLLVMASFDYNKWEFSMFHANFTKNIMPHSGHSYKTSHEIWFKEIFKYYDRLRTFGSLCYHSVRDQKHKRKRDFKNSEGLFMGYTFNTDSFDHSLNTCVVYDFETKKYINTIIISHVELFDSRGVLIRKDLPAGIINSKILSDPDLINKESVSASQPKISTEIDKFTGIPTIHCKPKNEHIVVSDDYDFNSFQNIIYEYDVYVEKGETVLTSAVVMIGGIGGSRTWVYLKQLLLKHYKAAFQILKLNSDKFDSFKPLFQYVSVNCKVNAREKSKSYDGIITAFDETNEYGKYFEVNFNTALGFDDTDAFQADKLRNIRSLNSNTVMMVSMKPLNYFLNRRSIDYIFKLTGHKFQSYISDQVTPDIFNSVYMTQFKDLFSESATMYNDLLSVPTRSLINAVHLIVPKLNGAFIYSVLKKLVNILQQHETNTSTKFVVIVPLWENEPYAALLKDSFELIHSYKAGESIFNVKENDVMISAGKLQWTYGVFSTKPTSHYTNQAAVFMTKTFNLNRTKSNPYRFKKVQNIYEFYKSLPDYTGPPSTLTPRNIGECVEFPDGKLFIGSYIAEVENLFNMNFAELVKRTPDMKVIDCFNLFKVKLDAEGFLERYKSRLVARGDMQKFMRDFFGVFAPVSGMETIRLILAFCVQKKLKTFHIDFKSAYIYGTLKETIYMKQPEGFIKFDSDGNEYVLKLLKSLYGLKQAGKIWRALLAKYLIEFGFVQSTQDPCVFVYNKNGILCILTTYVDDAPVGTNSVEFLDSLVKFFAAKVEKIEMNYTELKLLLGMKIESYKVTGMKLSHAHFIDRLCDLYVKYDKDIKTSPKIKTPMQKEFVDMKISDNKERVEENLMSSYQSLIGSLLWLSRTTRCDIAYATNVLTRFCSCPTIRHWKAAIYVLKYLYNTRDLGLTYEVSDEPDDKKLYTFCDANFCGSKDTGLSTSGFLIYYQGCLVHWGSRKQANVALSTVAAEFFALGESSENVPKLSLLIRTISETGNEIYSLNNTRESIMVDDEVCIVFCDSTGAIFDAENEVLNKTTKSFNTKYYHIRELVRDNVIRLIFVPTALQYADINTKALESPMFEQLRNKIFQQFSYVNFIRKMNASK